MMCELFEEAIAIRVCVLIYSLRCVVTMFPAGI